jgi:hypothetical protein
MLSSVNESEWFAELRLMSRRLSWPVYKHTLARNRPGNAAVPIMCVVFQVCVDVIDINVAIQYAEADLTWCWLILGDTQLLQITHLSL